MSNPSQYISSLFSLVGRTALITGGNRGIGAGLALSLASAGADIILVHRTPTSANDIKAKIEELGRKVYTYEANLADKNSIKGLINRIATEDARNIDILINCAGINRRHPAADFPDEDWDDVIQTNLSSTFTLSRDLGRHWLSQPGGFTRRKKIINIASVLTYFGSVQIPAYASSKGGIGQLTKALSNEWSGKGININAIAPGYIQTDFTSAIRDNEEYNSHIMARTPIGRWGIPEDLAGAVVYLASKASDYVCGEIHCVDGGFCGR